MPSHGTPSFGQVAPFVGDAMRAVLLLSEDLNSQVRDRWTGNSAGMQQLFRQALVGMTTIAVSSAQAAAGIVKVVTIQIGGDRTTDQMIETAKKDCGRGNVSGDITQKNMPSGYGKLRSVTLEFRQFDHDPYTDEVCDWINQPGFGHSDYEDGLRYREADPEVQREHSHIFIPEAPWCGAGGVPYALGLWGSVGRRGVGLGDCRPRLQWGRDCLFARRRYPPLAV